MKTRSKKKRSKAQDLEVKRSIKRTIVVKSNIFQQVRRISQTIVFLSTFSFSGIVVTCQQTRFLEKNRILARRQLQEKLDFHFNGENSLVAQYKREKAEKKQAKRIETKEKLEKKRAFKLELQADSPIDD